MRRIRITYHKTDSLRFIGHLDLHHLWIRTFRRAGIKVAYSQGFHPQPRIHMVSALSLGYTGRNELMECWLDDDPTLEEIQYKLTCSGHPGIRIRTVEDVDESTPALQTRLKGAHYEVQIPTRWSDGIVEKLKTLFSLDDITVERKKKSVNIRPFLKSYALDEESGDEKIRLRLHLSAGEGTTGRVDEVLELLAIDPLDCLVERTSVELA